MTCGRINELYEFQPFLRFWVVRLPVAYYSGVTYDVSTLLEILGALRRPSANPQQHL